MRRRWMLILNGLFVASGCVYHVQERVDQTACELASHPYDVAPETPAVKKVEQSKTPDSTPDNAQALANRPYDLQTTSYMQQEPAPRPGDGQRRVADRLRIPMEIPGAETPAVVLSRDRATQQAEIKKLYPELPPLPIEPQALTGPDGHPYTLASFQQIAAQHSPNLKQAVSDVEAARGNLIQAKAYPNPTVGFEADPSNDGSTPGVQGFFFDQTIKTAGKLKLQAAAAQKDLDNAELALRKARSDLATQVRQEYYALLIAKETVRVNRALARFTEAIYLLQKDLLTAGTVAPYEPAALRAQAYTARLALKQSISTYLYQWKQLTATVGLRQMPLSEVSGRVDAAIPYYDYDAVLGHVLRNHTDLLTARNTIEKNRYNLKLAQVTPVPDVDVRAAVLKEFSLPPMQFVPSVQVGVPIPVWDHNRGNIIASESALMRASEEPHRVETVLANNLANAFTNYKNNLDALEYYRGFILPDQIRAFRGVHDRRQGDPNVAFADIVTAQQTLVTNVQSYLTILGQIWTSVISVADLLQTDDLFQLAEPRAVPPLPDLEELPPLACNHDCVVSAGCTVAEPYRIKAAAPMSSATTTGTGKSSMQAAEASQPDAGSAIIDRQGVSQVEETAGRNRAGLPPAPFAPGFGVPRLGFNSPPSSNLSTPP
jgi:cobalt-zinc-cadmium efflux system outer membrane protein